MFGRETGGSETAIVVSMDRFPENRAPVRSPFDRNGAGIVGLTSWYTGPLETWPVRPLLACRVVVDSRFMLVYAANFCE